LEGTETILVVEDEPGLRRWLTEVLISYGYQVLAAEDGQRGLSLFHDSRRTDVVVSDLGLPEVGGLDLYRALKKMNRLVKMILVSGFVDETDRESMRKEGVDGFIQKPYQAVEVSEKIREVLDRNRAEPE